MYCQACGAENTEDARFCNMCGARFAQAGEAGGPLDGAGGAAPPAPGGPRNDPGATVLGVGTAEMEGAAAPPAGVAAVTGGAGASGAGGPNPFGGDSMLGVTLGGIGVKSAKKTWITILAIAAGLVAAGSLATWLAMRGGDGEGGHAEADDPFVLGMPLTEETDGVPAEPIEGDPTPEDIDFVTGAGGAPSASSSMGATGTMRSTTRRRSSAGGSSAGGSTAMAGGGSSAGGSSAGGSSAGGAGGSTAMGGGSSAGGSSAGGSSAGGGSTDTTMESGSGGSTMEAGSGSGSLPSDPGAAPEERDLEMELYGSRVRYVVRRYYAARAQSCFDRATRNDPSVSGTVVVAMTIGADGGVSRSRVQRNTTGNETLGSCLAAQVGTWRLPPPPGGSLDMTMPFSR